MSTRCREDPLEAALPTVLVYTLRQYPNVIRSQCVQNCLS